MMAGCELAWLGSGVAECGGWCWLGGWAGAKAQGRGGDSREQGAHGLTLYGVGEVNLPGLGIDKQVVDICFHPMCCPLCELRHVCTVCEK